MPLHWQRAELTLMETPRAFVGTVVRRDREILLVRQSPGHPLEGQWTVPWGGIENGETPSEAALRETFEEGGIVAKVDGLLGVQELPAPQYGSIGIAFLCTHVSGTPQPQDRETDAAQYFSLEALNELTEPVEPWSNWLIRRVFSGDVHVSYPDAASPLRPDGAYL